LSRAAHRCLITIGTGRANNYAHHHENVEISTEPKKFQK